MKIGFNKPCLTGKELDFIADAISRQHISGDGDYTRKCHHFFQSVYGFKKVLLTASCTDALEMTAILMDIQPGDEVIVPSYTFPSCANAFILRGARIVFADSRPDHPNLDIDSIQPLINKHTKAVIAVHYGGTACDMDKLMTLSRQHGFFVVEDAAQAIDSFYHGRPLGSIGHFGCISFHESKNITCGEGGLLVINDEHFAARAEIIWEKGTNRAAFFRGEISKYSWIDIGSSFLASDLSAAFLYAQLENLQSIQQKRKKCWDYYYTQLENQLPAFLPHIPPYASGNAHCFYLVCESGEQRKGLENYLQSKGVQAICHYLPLHNSEYFKDKHDGRPLPSAERFSDCLIRLPLFHELSTREQDYIIHHLKAFFTNQVTTPGKKLLIRQFTEGLLLLASLYDKVSI